MWNWKITLLSSFIRVGAPLLVRINLGPILWLVVPDKFFLKSYLGGNIGEPSSIVLEEAYICGKLNAWKSALGYEYSNRLIYSFLNATNFRTEKLIMDGIICADKIIVRIELRNPYRNWLWPKVIHSLFLIESFCNPIGLRFLIFFKMRQIKILYNF